MQSTHGDSLLPKLQPQSDGFPHEDVRVMTRMERLFQFVQLPIVEVGPRAAFVVGIRIIVLHVWLGFEDFA